MKKAQAALKSSKSPKKQSSRSSDSSSVGGSDARRDDERLSQEKFLSDCNELYKFVCSNDVSVIAKLLQANPSLIVRPFKVNQGNLLHHAVYYSSPEVCKILLKNGARNNDRNDYGWTPFMLACARNSSAIIKKLLETPGLMVDDVNDYGVTALLCAVYESNLSLVKILLVDIGCSPNKVLSIGRSIPGLSPLMMACHVGKSVGIVQALLQEGAECNNQNSLNGWSAIFYAINSACTQSLAMLQIKQTASVSDGKQSKISAAGAGMQIVKLLLDNGADIYVKSWSGKTALDVALERRCQDIAEMVMKYLGAEQDERTRTNFSVRTGDERHGIFDAITNDDASAIEDYIRQDVKCLAARDPEDQFTPLMLASIKGDLSLVKLFLDCGSQIDAYDNVQWTAIMYAAFYNHFELVQMLNDRKCPIIIPSPQLDSIDAQTQFLQSLTQNQEILELLKVGRLVSMDSLKPQSLLKGHYRTVSDEGAQSFSSQRAESEEKSTGWFSKLFAKKDSQAGQSLKQQDIDQIAAMKISMRPVQMKKKMTKSSFDDNRDYIDSSRTSPELQITQASIGTNGNGKNSPGIVGQLFHDVSHPDRSPRDPHYHDRSLSSRHSKDLSGDIESSQKQHSNNNNRRISSTNSRNSIHDNVSEKSIGSLRRQGNGSMTESVTFENITDVQSSSDVLVYLDLPQYITEEVKVMPLNQFVNSQDDQLAQIGIVNPGHRRIILLWCAKYKTAMMKLKLQQMQQTLGLPPNRISADKRSSTSLSLSSKFKNSDTHIEIDEQGDSSVSIALKDLPLTDTPGYSSYSVHSQGQRSKTATSLSLDNTKPYRKHIRNKSGGSTYTSSPSQQHHQSHNSPRLGPFNGLPQMTMTSSDESNKMNLIQQMKSNARSHAM
ncbi:hypothetical protein MIR68_004293 [Amoeboaphelidium protococcarum]|nr:hypothetical protein MIR68_004293 [Amoeboaphelidium protococcarum]